MNFVAKLVLSVRGSVCHQLLLSMLFSDLLLETAGAIGNMSAAELFLIE